MRYVESTCRAFKGGRRVVGAGLLLLLLTAGCRMPFGGFGRDLTPEEELRALIGDDWKASEEARDPQEKRLPEDELVDAQTTKIESAARPAKRKKPRKEAVAKENIRSTTAKEEPAADVEPVLEDQKRPPAMPRIRPGHILDIRVTVAGEMEVEERAKRVSSTGHLSLLLIGKTHVDGLSLTELTLLLESRYREYMREPVVDVSFILDNSPGAVSPWGYVTVLGTVAHPGRINIPPTEDLTLSMAIQLAGGLGPSARDTAIRITRTDASGGLSTREVNLRSAASEGQVENDVRLQEGDIIYVPEKVF